MMTTRKLQMLEIRHSVVVFNDDLVNGLQFRFARKALGLSRDELAEVLDEHTESMVAWEECRRVPHSVVVAMRSVLRYEKLVKAPGRAS